MPIGRHPHCYRPVGGALPNGRVAIVHELVSVVAEDLAEVVQLGPCRVTSRARQPVLSGKGRDRSNIAAGERQRESSAIGKNNREEEKRKQK